MMMKTTTTTTTIMLIITTIKKKKNDGDGGGIAAADDNDTDIDNGNLFRSAFPYNTILTPLLNKYKCNACCTQKSVGSVCWPQHFQSDTRSRPHG